MSNTAIIKRILDAISAYESGNTCSSPIAESIELHEPTLEAISREVRDRLHKLSVMIIEQDVSPLEEEMLGIKASKKAVSELRIILQEIANTVKSN